MFERAKVAAVTVRNDFVHYQSQDNQAPFDERLAGFFSPNLEAPIFIIGAPRSGTSFLGNCIASLPGISYHREPLATKLAMERVYCGEWDFAEAAAYYRRVYSWLMRIHFDGNLRFAEKTPRNCFIVEYLWQAFPDAKFIHLIRDGRDVAVSLGKKRWLQADPQKTRSQNFEPEGEEAGSYQRFWVEQERSQEFETTSVAHRAIWTWRRHVEAALAAFQLIPEDQKCTLKYENMVADPLSTADRIADYLGYADSKTARQMLRESMAQARAGSVGSWRSAFNEEQISQISLEAADLLARLNYTDGQPTAASI